MFDSRVMKRLLRNKTQTNICYLPQVTQQIRIFKLNERIQNGLSIFKVDEIFA